MTSAPARSCSVSAVLPHYGDGAITSALVRALLAQKPEPPAEIIVVDDASPEPFQPREGVTVRRREVNGGFGAAVNTGVELASHDLILILNSDIEIEPDFVERLVAAGRPLQPALVGPRVTDPAGDPVYSARRFPRTRHFVVEWLVPLARFRSLDAWHRAVGHDLRSRSEASFEADWLIGVALLVPREALLRVGGFDTRYHMNSEEVDLQLRLRKAGVPARFVGAITCRHEGGSSSGEIPIRNARLWRARFIYVAKWRGAAALRRLQVALAAASLINFGWRLLRRAAGRHVRPLAETVAELRMLRPR